MFDFEQFVIAEFQTKEWRPTASVRKLIRILAQSDGALSVQEISGKIRPKINATTIYRILEKLQTIGVIHEIENKFFRCQNPNNKTEDHHFLLCEKCHNTEEIFLNYREDISKQLMMEKNFKLKKVNLSFWGICQKCQSLE